MRIAIFAKRTTHHTGYGGLETQNNLLADELVNRGHEVVVFSPKWELEEGEINENGVRYVMVNAIYKFGGFFGISAKINKNNWLNKSVEVFLRFHKEQPFDVVLSQSAAGHGIIRKKKELNIKVITISHGTIIGEFQTFLKEMNLPSDFWKLVKNTGFVLNNFFIRQRDIILHSNRVIAVSNAVKEALVEETFIDDRRIEVIHNGIRPIDLLKGTENKCPVVIYVGRVEKSKGIQLLLQALSQISSEYYLKIIGTGPYLTKLQEQAEILKISGKVEFVGRVNHSAVLQHLAVSDIFVLPTLRVEGFPMTIVEAMFAHLPLLVSNMGGVADAVENEVNGFLVESNNADALKDALCTLINNAELRVEMGEKSYQKAVQQFTITTMVDGYEKVIQEVLKK